MPKNILIVEDEHHIAEAQKIILEGALGEEFAIHHAADGDEGLQKAKDLKPELIILDLMLPKRGGYDVCFNIRQDDALKDTRIVMVTAKNQPIDKDKGVMVGSDIYLTKPFEPEQLIDAVKKSLNF